MFTSGHEIRRIVSSSSGAPAPNVGGSLSRGWASESPALARKPQILKPAPNRAAEEEEDMGGPGVWAGRERGRYDIRAIGGSDQETDEPANCQRR